MNSFNHSKNIQLSKIQLTYNETFLLRKLYKFTFKKITFLVSAISKKHETIFFFFFSIEQTVPVYIF